MSICIYIPIYVYPYARIYCICFNPASPWAIGGLTPPVFPISLPFLPFPYFLISYIVMGEGLPSPFPLPWPKIGGAEGGSEHF